MLSKLRSFICAIDTMDYIKFLHKTIYHSLLTDSGPFFTEKDYPDLTGRKWVVTGATSGIGYETVKGLIKQGAEVWMVGRNPELLREKIDQLTKEVPHSGKLHPLFMDFADLTTIKPAVQELRSQTKHLNGIVHNAGVISYDTSARTKQGLELTVGVNNVAPELLQELLDPLIENETDGRIVWLSSLGHIQAPRNGFDVTIISNGSALRRYAMSKAISYIQSVQWTIKHPNSPVKSVSVHPGLIKTRLSRDLYWIVNKAADLFNNDAFWGGVVVLYAALSPTIENNEYAIPWGRPGLVRPDIYEAARDEHGKIITKWLQNKFCLALSGSTTVTN